MDLFAKCFEPSLADEAKSRGIYPYFHALESRQDKEVIMEGKRRIMLGSNNYLGLTTNENVIEAGVKAAITAWDWIGLFAISFVLPAVLSWIFAVILRKYGWIRENDLKLDI